VYPRILIEKKAKIRLNTGTMTLAQKIAFNGVVQMGGKIISTFLGLIAISLLTHYLGAERFGWYTTAITFLQFAGILIDFGLIPVTAQMLGSGKYDETKLLQNLLGFRFVSALIFFVLTPIIALLFPYPTEIKIAIALLSISFLAIAMNQIFTGYYQRELAMHIPALGELGGRIILVAGLLIGKYYEIDFISLMGVVTLASVVYTGIMWLAAAQRTRPTMAYDKIIWKSIAHTMWPVAISIVFNVVYLKGDTILLSLFRSQTEVGLYGAAYRVIDILAQTAMLMMGIVLPILAASFARKNVMEFKERYQHSFDLMMAIAIPITCGTGILSDQIIQVIAPPEFAPAGMMLRLLSIAVLGVYIGAVFGHTAVAIGEQKATMWVYISNAIITFAGYWYTIPRYGWIGGALFSIFSEWYTALILFAIVNARTPAQLSFVRCGKIIICGFGMSIVVYLTHRLPIMVPIMSGVITYIAMILFLRAYSWKTIKEIFTAPAKAL
jgi:O-antigen/teichoic acid export membrane protein